MSETESQKLQKSLEELALWEKGMSIAERDAEVYRLKRTQKQYEARRDILKSIPKFWYIVLAENDDFAEYVSVEDLKYLESIENLYVYYPVAESDSEDAIEHYKDFSITITFSGDSKDALVPTQEVTKFFKTIFKDGEETIISEPVDIEWPEELKQINPKLIKQENKGKTLTKEQKANYRSGMKSFFAWFAWTGEKPGKEFRDGEDLTRLIVDDLYLNALKYYVMALPNEDDDSEGSDEEDSSEGEELDLSEDDEPENSKRSADATSEQDAKRQK
ncbi:uncharacterized protein RJT20DRAFT_128357 [Scheffersomyces xylosifermentans]|uniref:uncharacterized protein n=1 Tax=Scheffersomyces xylosifermentans TaxID=1304137 RepID=UPI00315C817C